MLEVNVGSFEGVRLAGERLLDPEKGVWGITTPEGKILQYRFPLEDADRAWTPETALAYILKRDADIVLQSFVGYELGAAPRPEDVLPPERLRALSAVDTAPQFGSLRIKYGTGSRNQHFDRRFFERAGPKFEGRPFFFNHSDLTEFGRATPVGSIVKFLGAAPEGADFAYYLSASEGALRQKIRESVALGDLGYIRGVSIEGIPSQNDYVERDGIKYFHDLSHPTGIAIVGLEGLQGSRITS